MTSAEPTYPMPARFSELNSGDLFLYFHPKGPDFCIATGSPTQKLIAPFAVSLGERDNGPTLSMALDYKTGKEIDPTVLTFGKDYILQLSCRSSSWHDNPPAEGTPCILVTQDGEKLLRLGAMRDHPLLEFNQSPCYVDIASGVIHSAKPTVSPPLTNKARVHVFALEWQLLTKESVPREIVAQP